MSVYQYQQYPYVYQYQYQYPYYYQGGQVPVQYQLSPQKQNQPQFQSPQQSGNQLVPVQLPFYYYNEKKSKSSTTWTSNEDKLLRELKENQKLGWREISTFFHDRTPNACQFRWRRIISSLKSEQPSRSGSLKSEPSRASSRSSSISSISSVGSINKKSHHSLNYILN